MDWERLVSEHIADPEMRKQIIPALLRASLALEAAKLPEQPLSILTSAWVWKAVALMLKVNEVLPDTELAADALRLQREASAIHRRVKEIDSKQGALCEHIYRKVVEIDNKLGKISGIEGNLDALCERTLDVLDKDKVEHISFLELREILEGRVSREDVREEHEWILDALLNC